MGHGLVPDSVLGQKHDEDVDRWLLRSGQVAPGTSAEYIFDKPVRIVAVDYERCNDLYDGDVVYSVLLCVQVCLAAVEIVAKATLRSHFPSGKHKS
jgi:hypothetical protein